MRKFEIFVGVDIASVSFTAAVGEQPWKVRLTPREFENSPDGFQSLLDWLDKQRIPLKRMVVCLEAAGVYGEGLAYFLAAKDVAVAIEPPLKVKRAFKPNGPKTDAVDSLQIAEYACRFADQLHLWQPRQEILEQIQALLTTREQFVRQKIGLKNALNALTRKVVKTPLAEQAHQQMIAQYMRQIKSIDEEIERLIHQDPDLHQKLLLLTSIPGVGLLLASHMLLLTQHSLDPRQLAAHLGIAPHPHVSGAAIHRPDRSRRFGPATPRKLLYLAACSVRTHQPTFKAYFLRKTAEGKPPTLVLNNIQNSLLKIICAVLRDQRPFIPNHHSLHPLTRS